MLRGNLCPHKCLPSQLDSVGFNRHFNKLPEDPQGNMAVREGFEPSVPCGTHTFQACSFGHSDTSPFEGAYFMLLGA